ncbi:dihydrofolate synthase / folylpolyglutamate synthase [Desulfocicer vacuolatum DSM 3385]|uniref:Dihydrofolate synthase/folylpolyglutamate synthase n=1 Tax=Desulfocicer vacuolatum DSM 3385 TaxID=1121400 RepID=A0A1W2BU59_9BACT|nr:folylpolyglutamate synthase/dihydrofolate synthase family protein [Desulfocicer vacuolatum]SMC76088.1 dihydrofolate synthase / folylpolyglutamate synthase [Desulfocicer vacuolatum DSM 3385]
MEKLSYEQCLEELFALGRFGIKLELDTVAGILERLGSPEKTFNAVHIAGTNGKGSIASTVASILQTAGVTTGLYTSPHLIKFNERFIINGVQVSDDEIVDAYMAVKAVDTGERKATYFELTTTMAFYLFAQKKVQWAVIETGMGGRLDATNILNPALCLITNLSIEHTDYLGNTLEEIAAEKAGIIKQEVPVITGVSQPRALAVIKDTAQKKDAPLYTMGESFSTKAIIHSPSAPFDYQGIGLTLKDLETPLPGAHQIQNAALALAACELLSKSGPTNPRPPVITPETIRKGLLATRWPGRLEYILNEPHVILDGAHNLHSAENLGRFLREEGKPSHLTLVLGILDDKPYEKMLQFLVPTADRIIFTRPKINRNLDPAVLQRASKEFTRVETTIIDDVGEAAVHAIETAPSTGTVCIAGSLYVVGEARSCILKKYIK